MGDFKEKFSDLTSEHLLQVRARGDGLSHDAHQAIEEIFAERGEYLPPKPKTPISMSSSSAPESKTAKILKSTAIIILALIAMGVAKATAHTWFGVLVTIGVVIYFIANWIRRQGLTRDQREREDNEKKAEAQGLTELMVCAANGNLERIRELVEYGGDVNARSTSGATALMYAARNNHLAIIEFLLAAGANPKVQSDNKSTAADIARKFGHVTIAARLEQHVI